MVAVDESDTAKFALRKAIELAKDRHALLRLVHVVDLTPAYTDAAPYAVQYQKALRAAGQKLIDDYSSLARRAEIEFDAKVVVVETLGQHIYDAIEEQAEQWYLAFVLMHALTAAQAHLLPKNILMR